jgi:hypothetical protein
MGFYVTQGKFAREQKFVHLMLHQDNPAVLEEHVMNLPHRRAFVKQMGGSADQHLVILERSKLQIHVLSQVMLAVCLNLLKAQEMAWFG